MIPNPILIFTDGASKGNPGPGGFGAVIVSEGAVTELGGREEMTTNNRMELRAAIEALSFLQKLEAGSYKLTAYSDSTYLINGITKWIHGWRKNGWVTTAKKEVENRDLWESLGELVAGKKIEWHKVTGHADTPGNARADEIASAFGEGFKPELFSGPRANYKINIESIGARTGSAKSNGKAYSYVSLVGGKVMTHKTWDECKKRVHGKTGARYKKALTVQEEAELVREFGK